MKSFKDGGSEIVKFLHPLKKKTVTGTLGIGDEAVENLQHLNRIFLNPHNWFNVPATTPERVRRIWTGKRGRAAVNVLADQRKLRGSVEKDLREQLARALDEADRFKRLYEEAVGRMVRTGPVPTLREAYETFEANYTGRDPEHTKNVLYDLERFVKKFTDRREVDSFYGKEAELDAWLRDLKIVDVDKKGVPRRRHGQPISAGRKHTIRIYVLKMLANAGVKLNRGNVVPIKREEIRKGRGPIRWLEREQAQKLVKHLEAPWSDMFRVQVGIGLRPSELITLKSTDFSPEYTEVFLSPHDIHTLKTGTRHIQIPAELRKIIKAAIENAVKPKRQGRWKAYPAKLDPSSSSGQAELVFPNPNTGERWPSDRWFFRNYTKRVKAAAKAAGITMAVDARTGRRTCGSLLLRAGKSVEDVASIMGDSPETIREHYARILSGEVDPSAAAI